MADAYVQGRNLPINPSSSPSLLYDNLTVHRNLVVGPKHHLGQHAQRLVVSP